LARYASIAADLDVLGSIIIATRLRRIIDHAEKRLWINWG
jgi:hypothetical protein